MAIFKDWYVAGAWLWFALLLPGCPPDEFQIYDQFSPEQEVDCAEVPRPGESVNDVSTPAVTLYAEIPSSGEIVSLSDADYIPFADPIEVDVDLTDTFYVYTDGEDPQGLRSLAIHYKQWISCHLKGGLGQLIRVEGVVNSRHPSDYDEDGRTVCSRRYVFMPIRIAENPAWCGSNEYIQSYIDVYARANNFTNVGPLNVTARTPTVAFFNRQEDLPGEEEPLGCLRECNNTRDECMSDRTTPPEACIELHELCTGRCFQP